ncbi:MAG: hypothetical protein QGG54_05295 [Gammaproteobacteria bacterium]|nr:hypothetical protein [Gammaproteobacteria bacterium]
MGSTGVSDTLSSVISDSARGLDNWELGYGCQGLEADTVLDSLTDADFGGDGLVNR